jgi:hypothetical protein
MPLCTEVLRETVWKLAGVIFIACAVSRRAITRCRDENLWSLRFLRGLLIPFKSRRADSNRLSLLFTSDNCGGARGSRVVQNACKPGLIYLQLPSATPSPTLPVVSE